MAYDEATAERVRKMMKRRRGVSEQKMFGGIAFMLDGHMCVGVLDDELVVRLGDDGVLEALDEDHTRPFDFTGRVLNSFVYVEARGIRADEEIRAWIDRAVKFVRTLPAK